MRHYREPERAYRTPRGMPTTRLQRAKNVSVPFLSAAAAVAVAKGLACLWRGGFRQKKLTLSKENEGHEGSNGGGGEGLKRGREYECLKWEKNLVGEGESLWR